MLTLWITCWINLSLGRGGPHHPNLISPPPHKIIAGTIHHWIWINNITLASEDVKDEVQIDDFGRSFCLQVRRLGRKTKIFIDIQDYDYGNKILDTSFNKDYVWPKPANQEVKPIPKTVGHPSRPEKKSYSSYSV